MVRICWPVVNALSVLTCTIYTAAGHEGAVRRLRDAASRISSTLFDERPSVEQAKEQRISDLKDFLDQARRQQQEDERQAVRFRQHVLEQGNGTAAFDMDRCDFGRTSWALFVDGKDAERGPEAYGRDFVASMTRVWDYVQHDRSELDVERLLVLQSKACPEHQPIRTGDSYVMKELPSCTRVLPSASLEELLQDLPQDVVGVTRGADGRVEALYTRRMESKEVIHHLNEIIDTYKANLLSGRHQRALAVLLRSLAWLHPFTNCNGRLRTLLLQRELRYLRLGCGASMYNNNADIYFAATNTYERKMEEGLEMARLALESGEGPWTAPRRERHRAEFPIQQALQQQCVAAFALGKKSIG